MSKSVNLPPYNRAETGCTCPQCGFHRELVNLYPEGLRVAVSGAMAGFSGIPEGVKGTLIRITSPHLWVGNNKLVIKWDDYDSPTTCTAVKESWLPDYYINNYLKILEN